MSALDILTTCLPKIRAPSLGDNVYKEECCLSFDNPESEGGLYICMTTFLGFGKNFVKFYHNISNNRVFLHIKKTKKEVTSTQSSNGTPSEKKPKRFAIGLEGGFNLDNENNVEYEEKTKLVILPEFLEISLDDIEDIPSLVLTSVNGIMSSMAASKKEEAMAWDGEVRPVTKHGASLEQLGNGVKIPPSGWCCSKCNLTNNLWLNLTDGTILCGRKYFDGTGGNNHAVEHYKDKGYPLAVKLGTITPNGADVHSYDEDTMVEDPYIAKHLSHFGINMMNMEKTEQTMTELEIELNEKIGSEWNLIQEAGKNLKEVCGPGLTGLTNMGNSCYLNSIVQVLLTISEFKEQYATVERCQEIFKRNLSKLAWDPADMTSGLAQIANNPNYSTSRINEEIQRIVNLIVSDFQLQMCKVGLALNFPQCETSSDAKDLSENADVISKPKYITSPPILPRGLKRVVGKGHPEFMTNRQQDAHEFFLHLLSMIERDSHKSGNLNAGECFKFVMEERVECQQSKQVRYTKRPDYTWALPVPFEHATNKADVEAYLALKELNAKDSSVAVGDVVRATIPFSSCLNCFMQDEFVADFWSSAIQEKAEARKRTRFSTFPAYLVVQLKKFTVGEDWIPKKLDVSVAMPDTINLNEYRSTGRQESEVLLPDRDPPTQCEVDENAVLAISQMGFSHDRCREAIIATGNAGVEAAVMWLMENNSSGATVAEPGPPEENVSMIMSMGFSREQALKALRATNNNLERAADWIFSHIDELDSIDVAPPTSNPAPSLAVAGEGDVAMETASGVHDGPGNYELFAFISHMGTSVMCGHYVCHIKKDGRWVIFNDEKVAESEKPPKDLGYIYFYKRIAE